MKRLFNIQKSLLFAFIFFTIVGINAQEITWKIDASHSKIAFEITYFKIGEIKGVFNNYEGAFISNKENFDQFSMEINIETASINTNQEVRDKHLKTKDFFDAETHPKISFKSTDITKLSDKKYSVKGDFTMTGITKTIELNAVYKGSFIHPRFKKTVAVFNIEGIILREDFKVGTNYPGAKIALSNEVVLNAQIHLTKQ